MGPESSDCSGTDLPGFEGLPGSAAARVVALFEPVRYERGATLFDEGTPADWVFTLRSGRVKLLTASCGGRQQILRLHGPGEFVGLDALHRMFYANTAVATQPVEGYRAPRVDFAAIVSENADVAERILAQLETELDDARSTLCALGTLGALPRVARHLVALMREGGGLPSGGRPVRLDLPLSRRDTAAQLGMAEESLSRQLTRLQDRGVLRRDGRTLVVVDAPALAAAAG